jgi:glycine/sarcosine N-methyltransferase
MASKASDGTLRGVSASEFYDGLADRYHLIYEDWGEAVSRQGVVLDGLIRASLGIGPKRVLDCACGIGTQAIGLALQGHRVVASDASGGALARGRREAKARDVDIEFTRADFRDLDGIEGPFDVVVNCDNSLPHMEGSEDVARALSAMASVLRPGGLLIVSVRDYDHALAERPATESRFIAGPPRRFVDRLHEWDDGAGPMHTVHIFIVAEGKSGWTFSHHETRCRALPRAELDAAVAAAGFVDLTWHDGLRLGFHQPLLTARL